MPTATHSIYRSLDHANNDPLDNTAANLHWVTPSFNTLNMRRTAPSSGFFGFAKSGQRFKVVVAGVPNGTYNNAETATLIYNIITRLKYGSQLDKTPHLLNQVGVGADSLADTLLRVYEDSLLAPSPRVAAPVLPAAVLPPAAPSPSSLEPP
ncbi:hypothetical protein PaG_02659 [Moesziomyces aphidis]|uniref:HNH nuclease domain-containing protein n=1 Tax=Moesziomyces aphidis TaxID=84754 RepID=W3VQ33_MOEAP|nr:hypothetical protein PaG_02659 [Moesziomyces aphidis]